MRGPHGHVHSGRPRVYFGASEELCWPSFRFISGSRGLLLGDLRGFISGRGRFYLRLSPGFLKEPAQVWSKPPLVDLCAHAGLSQLPCRFNDAPVGSRRGFHRSPCGAGSTLGLPEQIQLFTAWGSP
eukprot:5277606-Pyramimonas_sp.AAC.1